MENPENSTIGCSTHVLLQQACKHEHMRQEGIAAVYRTAARFIQQGMFTFILPRWQPPQFPVQTLLRSSCDSSRTSLAPTSSLHRDATAVAFAATSPFLALSTAHRGRVSQRRRGRRRPRVRALEACVRDSSTDVPDTLDAAGSQESTRANTCDDKFDLALTLKAMGRRFEWRGALKRFRRAKEEGMVADNNVYRRGSWTFGLLFGVGVAWVGVLC